MAKTDWTEYAKSRLEGRTIVEVRYLSQAEAGNLDWHQRPLVMQLDDGSLIFPSQDDEGNDGGALFGQSEKGEDWLFPVLGA